MNNEKTLHSYSGIAATFYAMENYKEAKEYYVKILNAYKNIQSIEQEKIDKIEEKILECSGKATSIQKM